MTTMPVTTQEHVPIPVHVGPGPAAAALTVNDVIRVLKQRIFLILFVFFFVFGGTVGLTFWLLRNYPEYVSTSSVRVDSPYPRNPMEFGETILAVDLMNRFVADQMFLVKDEGLLAEALTDVDIRGTFWYKEESEKPELLEELKEDLIVKQAPESSFFMVGFGTKHKDDAPKIVNAIVDRYLQKVQDMSRQQYADELDEYTKRRDDIKRLLERVRGEKERFLADQLAIPGLTAGLNVEGELWRALAMEAARLEMEQLQLKAAFDNLKGLDPSEVEISPQMMIMIDQDPQVAGLKSALLSLRQQRMATLERVGPNHQALLAIDAQLDSHQKLLDDVLADKKDEARQYQISAAETAWLNGLQAQIQLEERVVEARDKQRDADRKLNEFQSLEDEQQLLEIQFTDLSDYINRLQLVVRDREIVRVHRISSAVPALEPSFPSWKMNLPAGTFLGMALGIGLAMLLEVMDTSVKTSRDVARHIHIPILGTVPDIDDEEIPIDQVEMAMHVAPRSMIAEAFRTIRTNLLLSAPAERQRSLLITSAKPEEGTTSIAINLAIAVAQNNRRVLLVDANFHRPMLKEIFPKARSEGLSNILIGVESLEGLVTQTDLPNLDVLSSGPVPPNPAELLASSYMQDLITQATDRYDQVIFDGPPVLLVSDALVLAGSLDGVVLVCRAKTSARGVIQRARDYLEQTNVRIFGGVLNAARVARGGYFREQIRTYYDYQPAESLEVASKPALPTEGQEDEPSSPDDEA